MSSRSEPRFRIRLDDGSEVAIPTLEALARRVDRGEVLPNTELHDIGTGNWSAARESAVVRFILEERESDGKAPLEAWKGELGLDPGPAPGPGGKDQGADPFDMDLTLEPSTPAPPEEAPPRPPPLRSRRGGPAEDLPYLDFSDEEEEPAAGEPEEPAKEPSAEEPPAKQPSTEEPAAEDPAAKLELEPEVTPQQAPEPDEPEEETPLPDAPTEHFPALVFPEDEGPAAAGPEEEEPAVEEPVEPVIEEPVLEEPAVQEPVAEAPKPEPPLEGPPKGAPGEAFPPLVFPGDERPAPEKPEPTGGTDVDEWLVGPSAEAEAPPEPPPSPPAPARRPPASPAKPRAEEKPPARAPRKPRGPRVRRPRAKWVVAVLAVAGLWAADVQYGDRLLDLAGFGIASTLEVPAQSGEPEAPSLVAGGLPDIAAVPTVPDGLEASLDRALDAVAARFAGVVDSLRSAHGLPETPPREWLSGYYLANATEFPAVRAFWEGYGSLVLELRGRDPGLYLDTARGAAVAPTAEGREALHEYLEHRYREMLPLRRDRYQHLILVARHAVELHDFLVDREAEIRFTPALGGEVPLDPVMEVGTENPEIRRELGARLDRLFQALDRSRGGGPPSPGGLGEDLFQRFGEG